MKRLSLKGKLTLLYTFLMTLVVCSVLALLFSFSNREILTSIQSQMEERVANARDNIAYNDGALEINSDFLELKHDIYLSLYASNGSFLYGKVPYGFDNSIVFANGQLRKIQGTDVQYYVLDYVCMIPDYGVVDIRGVTALSAAEQSLILTTRLALVLLPLIVLITALVGYSITRRTLRPVARITDTVQSIRDDGDLSRRIDLGSGQDEIYRLAATFDRMLASIEDSMKREQQFTSDVAHELRTPLSAMSLQCEDLLSLPDLTPETRDGLLLLQKKVKALSHIVSQLLTLSRMDQDRLAISSERIDLSELAQLAAEEIQDIAAGKKITVITDISPELYILGDETLMIRCLMNLLNNAVSYGKTGGHIWVRLYKDGSSVSGFVKDDGTGIAPGDLPHIWKRFYQADAARTDTESCGLGLSMVDWIVKKHGGSIRAESVPGQSTVFSFTFPLYS